MPVTVACPCGKKFKANDEAAGRKVKCPACGNAVTFPALKPDDGNGDPFANPLWETPKEAEPIKPALPQEQPVASVAQSQTTVMPCPFCGEEIQSVAKKCKHCGEFLDPAMRGTRAAPKWNRGFQYLLGGGVILVVVAVLFGVRIAWVEHARNEADRAQKEVERKRLEAKAREFQAGEEEMERLEIKMRESLERMNR